MSMVKGNKLLAFTAALNGLEYLLNRGDLSKFERNQIEAILRHAEYALLKKLPDTRAAEGKS